MGGAHVDSVNEEGPERAVGGDVDGIRELAEALAQAKHDRRLPLLLQAAQRQRQQLAALDPLLELVPAPHGEHGEGDRHHGVRNVAGCDEEDEDVGLVNELALPDWLLACRAWVAACGCQEASPVMVVRMAICVCFCWVPISRVSIVACIVDVCVLVIIRTIDA